MNVVRAARSTNLRVHHGVADRLVVLHAVTHRPSTKPCANTATERRAARASDQTTERCTAQTTCHATDERRYGGTEVAHLTTQPAAGAAQPVDLGELLSRRCPHL